MNKKWLKIGIGVASPISVAGLATGLVLGLKKNKDNSFEDPIMDPILATKSVTKNSASVKYFQERILHSGMQNTFLYSRNSKNISDKYVMLGSSDIDANKIIVDKSKPLKKLKIDFKKFSKKQEIDKAMDETNNTLFVFANKYKKENPDKRLGLNWNTNPAIDTIEIKVYEIKSLESDDKKLIKNYIDFLKGKKVNAKTWATNRSKQIYSKGKKIIDFARVMSAKNNVAWDKIQNFYPFDFNKTDTANNENFSVLDSLKKDGSPLNNAVRKNNEVWQTVEPKKEVNNPDESKTDDWMISKLNWSDNTSIDFKSNFYNNSKPFNINLLEKKIVVTQHSSIQFSDDSKEPTTLSLIFTFYKLGQESSMDFTGRSNKIIKPENIYVDKIDFNLKDDIIKPLADSQQLKTIENNSVNRNKVFNAVKDNWMPLINDRLIKEALEIINEFIPTIGTTLSDFVSTFDFLNKIKNIKIHDSTDNEEFLLDVLFNDAYDTDKIKGKSLNERIIDKFNSSDCLDPSKSFEIWFEKDFNEKFSIIPETETMKFSITDNWYKKGGDLKISTHKLLYYIYAGAKEIEPLIRQRLNMFLDDNTLKVNYYDEISIDVIFSFIAKLKSQKIIDENFLIKDLQDETKRNAALTKIVKAIQEKKRIVIPSELFGFFTNIDRKTSSLLSEFLETDYASNLLTLIIGDDNFEAILKDPLYELLKRVVSNIHSKEVEDAVNYFKGKIHIQELLKPSIEANFAGLFDKLFDGFGDLRSFRYEINAFLEPIISGYFPRMMAARIFKTPFIKDSKLIPSIVKGIKKSDINEIKEFLSSALRLTKTLNYPTFQGYLPSDMKLTISKINDIVDTNLSNKITDSEGTIKYSIDDAKLEKLAKLLKALI